MLVGNSGDWQESVEIESLLWLGAEILVVFSATLMLWYTGRFDASFHGIVFQYSCFSSVVHLEILDSTLALFHVIQHIIIKVRGHYFLYHKLSRPRLGYSHQSWRPKLRRR